MKKHGKRILLSTCFTICCYSGYCQSKMKIYVEAGAAYFSNFAVDSARHLTDFTTPAINPRLIINSTDNGAVAIESALSIRSKPNNNNTGHFAIHLPLLVTYSIGAGSGGNNDDMIKKKLGFTGGIGWGYFLQRTESSKHSSINNRFKEKMSTSGPEVQFGLRTPLTRELYIFNRKNPLDLVLSIKGNYLFNLKNRNKDIGILSVLIGFHF